MHSATLTQGFKQVKIRIPPQTKYLICQSGIYRLSIKEMIFVLWNFSFQCIIVGTSFPIITIITTFISLVILGIKF